MSVCQFYQRGYCKFGDKCWNEHTKGGQGNFIIYSFIAHYFDRPRRRRRHCLPLLVDGASVAQH